MLQGSNDTRHTKGASQHRALVVTTLSLGWSGAWKKGCPQEAELLLLTLQLPPGLATPLTTGRFQEFSKPQSYHLLTGNKTPQVWEALTVLG